MTDEIDTGDTVLHEPSKEKWLVAYVAGNNLYWCGWPPGSANTADCKLLKKASVYQRNDLLNEMANMKQEDHRRSYARNRLAEQDHHLEEIAKQINDFR